MKNSDMSGSEDGQLRSPGERSNMSVDEVEQETEALDIKPPQIYAAIEHSKRKEKKHYKEKLIHRERKRRDDEENGYNDSTGEEAERRSYAENKKLYKAVSSRTDLERYHRHQREFEREELPNFVRRYQKINDRSEEAGNSAHHSDYYHHYQTQHLHLRHHSRRVAVHKHRTDFYERGMHHSSVSKAEYYNNRQVYHDKHAEAKDAVRRKHKHDQQKDAESLEQDLRSRLLRKRHKCVKGSNEVNEPYESMQQNERMRESKKERSEREERGGDRVRKQAKIETVYIRQEKAEKANVIEVLDSPEAQTEEDKSKPMTSSAKLVVKEPVQKQTAVEDPDLLARKNKFLAAEREKEKRKETAREELEARREKRRLRAEMSNSALSPSAVAASVTAGLNVIKRKTNVDYAKHDKNYAKHKHSAAEEDNDVEQINSESSEEDESANEDTKMSDSESCSDSDSKNYKRRSQATKHTNSIDGNDDSDADIKNSSEGRTSKSPKNPNESTNRRRRHQKKHDLNGSLENANARNDNYKSDSSSLSSADSLNSRNSTSRSRSQSESRSSSRSYEQSKSDSSRHSYSHKRQNSRSSSSRASRSKSRSSSRKASQSDSRSRSRSEERDMLSNRERTSVSESSSNTLKRKHKTDTRDGSPAIDDKGEPLPNYYPGVQGCRSVEEFQCLNRIEEGTYGVVYRAKDKRTNEIVALKRLKMEKEKDGFPITSLREINTLLKGQHPNIVTVREIVVGSNMDKIFIVMDYVEHDLKSLMETMKTRKQSFLPGEVKCLTQQLLRAVQHLHDNWILHRDLKTSNLLLSHKGILKVGDFGLAREYGSPLRKYTSLVVTLWYRSPELLLCSPEYSTPVDIWSVGCIFAEFLQMSPLFPGKSEVDSLNRIFKLLGTPNEKIWPGYNELPAVKNMISQNSQFAEYASSNLHKQFADKTCESGINLLQGLLTYDPKQRLTAESALRHTYFKELPLPIDPSMFPTWPAKSELGVRKALASSPKPPSGGSQFKQLGKDDIVASSSTKVSGIITGNKKTAANSGFVLNAGLEQRQLAMAPGFTLKF